MDKFEKVVALAKRRGFVFPSSEIYGGLANVYDYGPVGAELIKNIRDLWWKTFIHDRADVVGMESQIFMHPAVWKASGHVDGFHDPLIECRNCHNRHRADHLLSGLEEIDPDDYDNAGLGKLIGKHKIKCPNCGKKDWDDIKNFNLLFKSHIGSTEDNQSVLYLRGETAQGMYVQFRNILNSSRQKVPFGIAQLGKAFRNEITKGKFIFRTLEFEQMELQYFIEEKNWEKEFDVWGKEIENWYMKILGIDKKKFKWAPHHPEKLAHYAKRAEDLQYKFPWGFDEVSGLHYRTDFDLTTHEKHSGKDLHYTDPKSGKKYVPHVVESTYGTGRNMMMVLMDAYSEKDSRVVMKISPNIAPYKVAVFPLVANKPKIIKKAEEVFDKLKTSFHATFDARGNIGKRYASQDEIGTPFCVTVDYDSLEDDTVTVRDRDTAEQERIAVDKLSNYLQTKLR